MKSTLLMAALIAVMLTACGKKEESATSGASPAPTTAPAQAQSGEAAQPANPAAETAASAEQKPEEKK